MIEYESLLILGMNLLVSACLVSFVGYDGPVLVSLLLYKKKNKKLAVSGGIMMNLNISFRINLLLTM